MDKELTIDSVSNGLLRVIGSIFILLGAAVPAAALSVAIAWSIVRITIVWQLLMPEILFGGASVKVLWTLILVTSISTFITTVGATLLALLTVKVIKYL